MLRYIARRVLLFLPTLIGVNLFVFLMFFMVNTPDHMAMQALGEKASTPEQIMRWKSARGYDLPYFFNGKERWGRCFTRTIFFQKSVKLLWFDFGESDTDGQPIGPEILKRIPPTLCLAVPIFAVSLFFNVILAMITAARHGTPLDSAVQFACVLLMSVSSLIYIIAGQYFFGKMLGLVPVSGFLPGWDMLRFLALPVLVGVVGNLGAGIRFYKVLFLEEMGRDYVRTARSKGLPEERILFVHVLKNALIPIVTNVPVQMLLLIMGSMMMEKFFSIPGMGRYTISAINSQDFAVVRAMVFIGSVLYMVGLLATDIGYSLVDPRVRPGGRE